MELSFFGLQFVQNLATFGLKGDAWKKKSKNVNVKYCSDGRLVTLKMIQKGVELLLDDKKQLFDTTVEFSINNLILTTEKRNKIGNK